MSPPATVFWFCILMLAYVYAGYPLLCWLLSRLGASRAPEPPMVPPAGTEPSVSILIAAYNEAAHIAATLENKLSQVYPEQKLEILVVSDGSEDATDERVRAVAAERGGGRLRLVRQEPRAGKTAGLNRLVALARGELLVFSDANSLWAPRALRHLVAPFGDPAVGYATGRMVYRAPDGSLSGEGCSLYMRYENQLRAWETRLGSVVGVDGGIDAVRSELYRPMRPDQLPDFVLPLAVRRSGYRVVYQPAALLYEDALGAAREEFRMRVRVTLRALHALRDMRGLLDPFRFGLYSWQLLSHKVLRYLAPLFQAGALVANCVLAFGSPAWGALLVLQVAFYLAAAAGLLLPRMPWRGALMPAAYLCLINAASAFAWWGFLRGKRQVIWRPRT
jgi:cellulose synthase/poly-beta-1,6-N-acetylglucosamine synthase-like glycosyltransferase